MLSVQQAHLVLKARLSPMVTVETRGGELISVELARGEDDDEGEDATKAAESVADSDAVGGVYDHVKRKGAAARGNSQILSSSLTTEKKGAHGTTQKNRKQQQQPTVVVNNRGSEARSAPRSGRHVGEEENDEENEGEELMEEDFGSQQLQHKPQDDFDGYGGVPVSSPQPQLIPVVSRKMSVNQCECGFEGDLRSHEAEFGKIPKEMSLLLQGWTVLFSSGSEPWRRHLTLMAERLGMVVVPEFDGEVLEHAKKLQLVTLSSGARRTRKYLLSLVLGFPCLHWSWLRDAAVQNVPTDPLHYKLPAGTIDGQEVLQSATPVNVFQSLTVGLVPATTQFIAFWRDILTYAGATVVDRSRVTRDLSEGSLLLCEEAPAESVYTQAAAHDVRVVSSDWAVNCIVAQRLLPFPDNPFPEAGSS